MLNYEVKNKEEEKMQLGQRIAKIRKEQGLTQEAFAEKFHVY